MQAEPLLLLRPRLRRRLLPRRRQTTDASHTRAFAFFEEQLDRVKRVTPRTAHVRSAFGFGGWRIVLVDIDPA
jgi:hypothetical protein